MHKGGGRWVGSNKVVELKKKKKDKPEATMAFYDASQCAETTITCSILITHKNINIVI